MIRANNSTSWVGRRGYGNFPVNTGNWTLFCRFKYNGTPAALKTAQVLFLFSGDSDFSGSYLSCSSSAVATSDIDFEIFNGTTTVNSVNTAVIASSQNWFALTYNSTTHAVAITVNGVLVDTLTINLSAVTWTNITGLGFSIVSDGADVSIAYCRAWSNILSGSELATEAASKIAVKTTGLLWDNPLQASIDLTAHNNTLNHLTATGTVITDTTDPLVSIIAGPPTNTTPANAITIDYDSVIFQDVNSAGVAVPKTWYLIPATNEGIKIIGAVAFGDLVTYKPSINIFEGLANANANITYRGFGFSGGSDLNSPFQVPIDTSKDYYYSAARNAAVAASTLQISVLKSLNLPVPVGSLMVNDDTGGYICAMDVGTGYPIHFFTVAHNPFGEGGNPLNNGTIVLCNDDNNLPVLFNSQFNLIRELTEVTGVSSGSTSSNLVDTFAIGKWPAGSIVRLCNSLGVVNPTIYNTGSGNINALGLNTDVSKFYFAGSNSTNQPIKTWIIGSNSAGSDLFAADATQFTPKGPILVLTNSIIVLPRVDNSSPKHFIVKIVDDTGSLLHTYDLGAVNTTNSNDSRLATDPANPTFFWAWGKQNPGPGLSFFNKIRVADGVLLVNLRDVVQYESGLYFATGVDTNTPVRFGHSESCPFWINRVALFSSPNAPGSGLYFLTGTNIQNPKLTHDVRWIDAAAGTKENVAIPTPFWELLADGDTDSDA